MYLQNEASFAKLKKYIDVAFALETEEAQIKVSAAFKGEAERHKKYVAAVGSGTNFSESFNALMKAVFEPLNIPEYKYGAVVFERACISDKVYRSMRNGGKNYSPSLRTITALCAGFDFDITIAEMLLQKCGRAFTNSDEHIALRIILTAYRGCGITERNDYLETMGYGRLTDDK